MPDGRGCCLSSLLGHIGYIQLFLTCNLRTALERNQSRFPSIPEAIVIQMDRQFDYGRDGDPWTWKLSTEHTIK
jgi:hypothetical protein